MVDHDLLIVKLVIIIVWSTVGTQNLVMVRDDSDAMRLIDSA